MKTRSTTIIGLIHNGKAAMAGDGQVSFDETVVNSKAVKVRTMQDGQVLSGFAGTAADALGRHGGDHPAHEVVPAAGGVALEASAQRRPVLHHTLRHGQLRQGAGRESRAVGIEPDGLHAMGHSEGADPA